MEKIEIALAPSKGLEDPQLINAARDLNHDLRDLQATMLQVATSTARFLAHVDRMRVNEDFRKIDASVRAMTDKLKEATVSLEQSADERRRVLAPDQAAMLVALGKDPNTGQSRDIIPTVDIVELFRSRGQFAHHDAARFAMDLKAKGYVEPLTSSEYRLTAAGKEFCHRNRYRVRIALSAVYRFAIEHISPCLGIASVLVGVGFWLGSQF